jgi:hypothetical protein
LQAAKRFPQRKPAGTGEVGEILEDIAADSKRAGDVIQRLSVLFNGADAHLEPVDLNSIVADVVELADRRLLEDIVSVTMRLATDVPAGYAHRAQLKHNASESNFSVHRGEAASSRRDHALNTAAKRRLHIRGRSH